MNLQNKSFLGLTWKGWMLFLLFATVLIYYSVFDVYNPFTGPFESWERERGIIHKSWHKINTLREIADTFTVLFKNIAN